MTRVLALALVVASAALLSCNVNEYCVNCADPDGGPSDGAVDDGGTADDGGDDNDACSPGAVEACNGRDDDCDLQVDEDVPQVGTACGSDVGECVAGTYECTAGQLRCNGTGGSPETCDNQDDDCDGRVDEGNPGGGVVCGTDFGECQSGITSCDDGEIRCVGAVGMPGQNPEICDGLDNDCDNRFDEGIGSLGSCGATDVGLCEFGNLMCVGGSPVCVGAVGPIAEVCDNLDQDCDGNPTNGFNLDTDPRNCGMCNRVCTVPHAVAGCAAPGNCTVASCNPGHYDINGEVIDGCEYACTYQGPQEGCNQQDEDCDQRIDEDLIVPDICDHDGACAGTVATCEPGGFACVYGPDVSTDASGNIVPETTCDGIDNDCDGRVDESHPTVGQACNDGGVGVCRGTGVQVCNAANPTGPTVCEILTPGQPSGPETCDNEDDDCDGRVDEGASQDWVALGGGREIFRWEASRPDSSAGAQGSTTTRACSKGGVLPWTNVTYPQARAACQAIGADLCSEQDWHRACSAVSRQAFPIAGPANTSGFVFIEAENYSAISTATSGGVLRAWVPATSPTGYSGISAMQAQPNTGANVSAANAPTQAPRLEYQVQFAATGNHYVWVRMYGPDDNDDSVHVAIDGSGGSIQSIDADSNSTWIWRRASAINISGSVAAPRTLTLYMQQDGVRIDAIAITRSNTTTAPSFTAASQGGTWSYATNNTTYQLGVCNEDDYDTNGALAGDQDDILVGGNRASCYADWGAAGRVNDLSGNVKEWTLARQPGINPMRGGASNNEGSGITCSLAFTAADDNFFFPNVGFRCCR